MYKRKKGRRLRENVAKGAAGVQTRKQLFNIYSISEKGLFLADALCVCLMCRRVLNMCKRSHVESRPLKREKGEKYVQRLLELEYRQYVQTVKVTGILCAVSTSGVFKTKDPQ